jgi:sucrose-6-phosphate hydrolase SacC (GH32 family)
MCYKVGKIRKENVMFKQKIALLVSAIVCFCTISAFAADREFTFEGKYLNIPVSNEAPRCLLSLQVDGKKVREFQIRLAPDEPDYWLYLEVQDFIGKKGSLNARELADGQMKGFKAIYNDKTFPGEEYLYKEALRPQFHFSSKRGWNNDPNGLVYYKGEWHMFYQHNPFGWLHGNMTWGHAISKDLVHWVEQGDKLHPDEWGTMWSGSGVVDWNNTTGFQTGDEPPLILIYTNAGGQNAWSEGKPFTQGIAYSNDRGRTWTKYDGNPVQGHLKQGNRDPKVIWWEPTNEWAIVMLLSGNEMAFFRSPDLKRWELQSLFKSFHECPELFQLAVDGDEDNKKWVHYGATGEYFIGEFNGSEFKPEMESIRYNYGNYFDASQTFNDIPKEDGRCIQIAWGRVDLPGMPFNQQMTFPVSLTLHTTEDGLRMFANPVKEIEKLHGKEHKWKDEKLDPGKNPLEKFKGDAFDISAEIAVGDAEEIGFNIDGFPISYDVKEGLLTGGDGSSGGGFSPTETIAKLDPIDGKISFRILVDRSSVEIFANGGRVYMPMKAKRNLSNKSQRIYAKGGSANIVKMTVNEIKPIWPK